jgi:hypothetical protein
MTLGLRNLSGETTELDDEQSVALRMSFRVGCWPRKTTAMTRPGWSRMAWRIAVRA